MGSSSIERLSAASASRSAPRELCTRPNAFQIVVEPGAIATARFEVGERAFQIAFDPCLVVGARFERGRVVGIDGKRPVDGRLHLLAVVDEKRQLRAVGRQGRIVGITRLGPLDDIDRSRNVLEEAGGPGFRKRGIGPAAVHDRRCLDAVRVGQRAREIAAVERDRAAPGVEPRRGLLEQPRRLGVAVLRAGDERIDEIEPCLLRRRQAELARLCGGVERRLPAVIGERHFGQRQPVLGASRVSGDCPRSARVRGACPGWRAARPASS